jgi:leucyl-tRNA synthetase
VEDTVEVPVQVNGKVRSRITVAPSATEQEHLAAALADEKVQAALGGKDPVKTIVVPGRTVNLVVGK